MPHLWTISYCGESWRQLWHPVAILHTDQAVGIPWLVFYGPLFYPLLGLPAAVLDEGLVLKLFLLALGILQFSLIRKAGQKQGITPLWANTIALLVCWTVYPLSNLYNRGAIPEYVAVSYVHCAVSCLLIAMAPEDPLSAKRVHVAGFFLFACLCIGTHPITGLYSIFIYAMLISLCLADGLRASLLATGPRFLLVCLGLSLLVLSPWLWAVSQEAAALEIARLASVPKAKTLFFDWWVTRLSPVPMDIRWLTQPNSALSTPFLDAQMNTPLGGLTLLVLAASLLQITKRKSWSSLYVPLISMIWLTFFFWISLAEEGLSILPKQFWTIQFVYRTVSYLNLATLLCLFFLARRIISMTGVSKDSLASMLIMSLLISWSSTSLILKINHGAAAQTLQPKPSLLRQAERESYTLTLHPFFYGHSEMTQWRRYQSIPGDQITQKIVFKPGRGDHFAQIEPLELNLKESGWIATNVQAFSWNKILVDGNMITDRDLGIHDSPNKQFAIRIEKGPHRLSYRPETSWGWAVLSTVSSFTLLSVAVGVVVLYVRQRPKRTLTSVRRR